MKHIFQSLSKSLWGEEKHFHEFILSNTAITQLRENVFENITFERIQLFADSLKYINTNAFEGTNSYVKGFETNCPLLRNNPPESDFFAVLSSMNNLGFIPMNNADITEIPSNAFNGSQQHSATIKFQKWNLKKVGDKVFLTSEIELDFFALQ